MAAGGHDVRRSAWRRGAAVIAGTAMGVGSLVALPGRVQEPAATRPHRLVLVYGDSLTAEATPYFAGIAKYFTTSVSVRVAGEPGEATCDALARMGREAAELHPAAVVIAFSGNALTPCMRDRAGNPLEGGAWLSKYRKDTERAASLFRPTGAAIYLVGTPTNWYAELKADPWLGRLKATYQGIAKASRRVNYVDSSPLLLRDGRWTMELPCLDGEPCTGGTDASGRPVNQVRAPDGVHFCPVTHAPASPCPVYASGAMRFALSIVVPVLHAVVGRLDHQSVLGPKTHQK